MNAGFLIIGLILLLVGIFISAEAQALAANPGWLTTLLGSTLDAIQQTGVWMAIIGIFLVVISVLF